MQKNKILQESDAKNCPKCHKVIWTPKAYNVEKIECIHCGEIVKPEEYGTHALNLINKL